MSHQTLSSSQSSGGPNLRKRTRQTASDESYRPASSPSGAQPANPDETPKKRKKLATSLAPDAKSRVIHAYSKAAGKPEVLRCCINEISSKDHPIQFSHVIASSTSRVEITKLEWSWNLRYDTLNLDSTKNIFPVSAELHILFDRMQDGKPTGWFLLPDEPAVILNMHASYVADKVEVKPGTTLNKRRDPSGFYGNKTQYRYRLNPLSSMARSWAIKRYMAPSEENAEFSLNNVKFFQYPFEELPPITLHIPFHYVIVNTGLKLVQLHGQREPDIASRFEDVINRSNHSSLVTLHAVYNMYLAWTNVEPTDAWKNNEEEQNPAADLHSRTGPHGGDHRSRRSHNSNRSAPSATSSAPGGRSRGNVKAQRHATGESLTPSDSASLISGFGSTGSNSEVYVDDEDEEYEDQEFLEGIKLWANDVWSATHCDTTSGFDSDGALVDVGSVSCKVDDMVTQQADGAHIVNV